MPDLISAALAGVKSACAAERDCDKAPIVFELSEVSPLDSQWRIGVRCSARDHDILWAQCAEGASLRWSGADAANSGWGEIIEVHSDSNELIVAADGSVDPVAGFTAQIEQVDFISPLQARWDDEAWRDRMASSVAERSPPCLLPVSASGFTWLRTRQCRAFDLVAHRHGFLWGPPGTGKTVTTAALVAAWVTVHPESRVLLIAATNPAVDQLLLATDRALAELGHDVHASGSPRRSCRRLGRQADRRRYRGAAHLLPSCPDGREPRAQVQEVLTHARVVALTATRALLETPFLANFSPFDLLVVDEASQLPLALALALLPLAKQGLYAGDPAQLAPVVRASTPEADNWLRRSLFDLRAGLGPPEATVLLGEQARMAAPICEHVGRLFYNRQLSVCPRAAADPRWSEVRAQAAGDRPAFEVIPVAEPGRFSRSRGGPVREASAALLVVEVRAALAYVPVGDVLVLTPFRAQVRLIREVFKAAGLGGVSVSTVHRAQGGERLVVFFDPVLGKSAFLRGQAGARLINVAFSRAQARLVLLLSAQDRHNPLLDAE